MFDPLSLLPEMFEQNNSLCKKQVLKGKLDNFKRMFIKMEKFLYVDKRLC